MGQPEVALTVFKQLHTDRSGYEGTPCHDKEVELGLGSLYQDTEQYQAASTTFKQFRPLWA